jgi:hypothetical protein
MSNVVLNSGSGGATLGTDQVAGVDYQKVKVTYSTDGSTPVSVDATHQLPVLATQNGTWNINNVSGTVSLPTGASTAAKQPALGTAGTASSDVITIQGIASMTKLLVTPDSVALPNNQSVNVSQINGVTPLMGNGVTGTGSQRVTIASDNTAFTVNAAQSGTWNVTNVSGTVSLPTGAATAAKQPALGTAGTASSDVITIQGIASMTKLLVTPDSVALPANQSVNVAQINGVTTTMGNGVSGTGVQRVTIASDSTGQVALATGSNTIGSLTANQSVNVAQINGVTALMGNGVTGTGSQRVTIASDNTAFTVNSAQSGTWTVQPGNTANTTAWLVQDVAGTTGGMSFNGFVGAASNNKTQIKGSAGTLYLISVQNLAATPVYLKVFNNTSAGVTAGTTACDFQFMIPGNTAGAGVVLDSTKGIAMGTGITIMLTAAISTTDNTSVSANQQVVTIGYK